MTTIYQLSGRGECVLSKYAKNHNGYAIRRYKGKSVRAHRLAWLLERGPIPPGKVIDHLCGNRACVNVAHMEVVTQRENVLRGASVVAKNAKKTHCKRGHEFRPETTYSNDGTNRQCLLCRRIREAAA